MGRAYVPAVKWEFDLLEFGEKYSTKGKKLGTTLKESWPLRSWNYPKLQHSISHSIKITLGGSDFQPHLPTN